MRCVSRWVVCGVRRYFRAPSWQLYCRRSLSVAHHNPYFPVPEHLKEVQGESVRAVYDLLLESTTELESSVEEEEDDLDFEEESEGRDTVDSDLLFIDEDCEKFQGDVLTMLNSKLFRAFCRRQPQASKLPPWKAVRKRLHDFSEFLTQRFRIAPTTLTIAPLLARMHEKGGRNKTRRQLFKQLHRDLVAFLHSDDWHKPIPYFSLGEVASDPMVPELMDLSEPHWWFPKARRLQRHIVMHLGPTNSGKTFHALRRLAEVNSGVYCGPLRLLAAEVQEKLCTESGVMCDLLTGQEVIRLPHATHISCTVEMCDVQRRVAVGVLDECQMMANLERGDAWTRAFLGLPAAEIHVCGEAGIEGAIEELAMVCGDTVEVKRYDRLTPLRVERKHIRTVKNIKQGDCVICFSRKNIYSSKRAIEAGTDLKCSVVYGKLPADSRRKQAELFNSAETHVLVASDAVGMGLNLNIRRVVFSTLEKFDGSDQRPLTVSEVKQIAGRAGRFNVHDVGFVSSFIRSDLSTLRDRFRQSTKPLKQVCLFPPFDMLEAVHNHKPELPFSQILRLFDRFHEIDESVYFFKHDQNIHEAARVLDSVNLTFKDRVKFCLAPVTEKTLPVLRNWAVEFVARGAVPLDSIVSEVATQARTVIEDPFMVHLNDMLQQMETITHILDVYIWLANRFPRAFVDVQTARDYSTEIASLIDQTIQLDSDNNNNASLFGIGNFKLEGLARKRQGKARKHKPKRTPAPKDFWQKMSGDPL